MHYACEMFTCTTSNTGKKKLVTETVATVTKIYFLKFSCVTDS